jgi:hypothetical protein
MDSTHAAGADESDERAIASGQVALDADTRVGLISKHPPVDPPRRQSYVHLESDEESVSDSDESFVLDLFHVEGNKDVPGTWTLETTLSGGEDEEIKISKDECEALRSELRILAATQFMRKYLHEEDPKYSVKELLYAFGCKLVRIATRLIDD